MSEPAAILSSIYEQNLQRDCQLAAHRKAALRMISIGRSKGVGHPHDIKSDVGPHQQSENRPVPISASSNSLFRSLPSSARGIAALPLHMGTISVAKEGELKDVAVGRYVRGKARFQFPACFRGTVQPKPQFRAPIGALSNLLLTADNYSVCLEQLLVAWPCWHLRSNRPRDRQSICSTRLDSNWTLPRG